MGLLQRLSGINKHRPKPTKPCLTTPTPLPAEPLPRSSTTESVCDEVDALDKRSGVFTPSLDPLPSPVRSIKQSPINKTSSVTERTEPRTAAVTTDFDTRSYTSYCINAPLEILITGGSQIDRSTVIQLAFDDAQPTHSKHKAGEAFRTKLVVDGILYDLDLITTDATDVIKSQAQPDLVYHDLMQFDGMVVCYDINNHASSDSLADLLNALMNWKGPLCMVGLNTDMARTQCTIDQQLAASFETPSAAIDVYTTEGEKQLQAVYTTLVQKILQHSPSKPSTSPTSSVSMAYQHSSTWSSSSLSSSLPSKKDHHEPARIPRSQQRYDLLSLVSIDDTTPSIHSPPTGYLTPPMSPIRTVPIRLSGLPSTPSSDPGYSVADIVNAFTLWDYHDQDMLTTIFLTFYRKFMTPYQLLQSLIERFEQDYGCDLQPTRFQERIRTILCLWLSQHWGDFYHGRSYHTLNRFLQRLGNSHGLSAMYQLLAPLITRPGPMCDPDTMWGMTDDEPDDTSAHSFYGLWAPSISTMLSMSSSLDKSTDDRHPSVTSSLDWYNEAAPTTTISSRLSSQPPLSATFCSSASLQDTTLKSQGGEQHRTTTTAELKKNDWPLADEPALFGGGIMLLEATGRRPFSLHRLQSSMRHKLQHRYALLMDLPVDLLAEQLTWAELTLYRSIKPRDYIRHLWGEKGASEAMVASISHGNFIKGWVVTMILIQSHHGKRAALLDKFIDLCHCLYQDHRNYNTLAAMLQGLTQVLDCLKHTMDQAKAKQLEQLVTLMQPDGNFALYRQDLEDSNDGSSIPYLRVHRQDIVTIAATQRDVTIGGGIHWEKFKVMGEIILQLTQAGTLATTIQPNPFVLAFLSDTSLLTEKERICRLDDLREK